MCLASAGPVHPLRASATLPLGSARPLPAAHNHGRVAAGADDSGGASLLFAGWRGRDSVA